jgi:predicted RNA-binding protein YlxR (DUF448 family)
VACGRRAPKDSLRRLALEAGRVVPDPAARRAGRGAYVCNAACAGEAVRRGALARAFRRAVTVPDDLVESIG